MFCQLGFIKQSFKLLPIMLYQANFYTNTKVLSGSEFHTIPTKANQIELHTDTNQKAHTNVVASAIFVANKMITSNIDDANVIVITPGNVAPKKVNANRTTIAHSNAAPTKSDA